MTLPYNNTQTYFTGVTGISKEVGSGTGGDAGGENRIVVTGAIPKFMVGTFYTNGDVVAFQNQTYTAANTATDVNDEVITTFAGAVAPNVSGAPWTLNSSNALTRTVREVTGTYNQGVGASSRFVPSEFSFDVENASYLRIGNTSTTTLINFGVPFTTDGNDAALDRSNWMTDETGLVQVSKRMPFNFKYDAAPGGNGGGNLNFIRGNNTTCNLIGCDFNIFTSSQAAGQLSGDGQYSHIHFGGSGTSADNSNIGLYNCRVTIRQASSLENGRIKFYSNNLRMDGLQFDARSLETGTIEMTANSFPDFIRGLSVLDDFTASSGANTRQLVILLATSTFDQTLTGVDLRNVVLWQAGGTTATARVRDGLFNTIKAYDIGTGAESNSRRGIIMGERTLTGTVTLNGVAPSSAPEFQLTQLQSDANEGEWRYTRSGNVFSFAAVTGGVPIAADANLSPTNPISATGALSVVMEQYRFPHDTTDRRTVEMRNKYRYAICQFGYVPFVEDDFYLGGRFNSASDEPTYFGMLATGGRTEYDVTGQSQGIIDLAEDVVVAANTFTEATYTNTYRTTNWDDLYVAFHNFATNRNDIGEKGTINVSSAVNTAANITNPEITLVDGTITLSGDEFRVGSVAYSATNDRYRIQVASTFATKSGGVSAITKSGNIVLDGIIPNGLTLAGTGSGTGVLNLSGFDLRVAVPTLAQSIFVDCDFTDANITTAVASGTTRYIRFNNCTGSPVITNTGTGTLVVYDAPASATYSGTINNRTFITHTIELNEVAQNSKLSLVRWASSVSDTNLTTPGAFSNTGFSPDGDGNSLSIEFDIPSTSAGVAHNIWAAIYYDGYYEKAITASNVGSDTALTALTSAELDFSIANSSLVLTTGTDLLDITVASIASATADITATLNDTEGGSLSSGWTNPVARMGIRRGLQESNQYAEALAQGFISEEWFTWNETGTVIAETGRLVYEHVDSNVIFEPAGRVLLADGTDQWRSVSSTQVNRRIVFDPDAAGAKGPEIRSIIQDEVETIETDLTAVKNNTDLIPGLY